MGINKSGITDPSMMIQGGHVIISPDGLILNGGIATPELEHPPAVIEDTKEIALPPLREIYTETVPARIKEWFVCGEGVVRICQVAAVAIPLAITAIITSWVVGILTWVVANAHVIATSVVTVLALAALGAYLGRGRRGGGGTVPVKACPKSGIKGPIPIPIEFIRR
jgi:hypothetical protein